MEPKYCEYCGELLSNRCDCKRLQAEYAADLLEELENRPDTQYGWYQQDLIDQRKFQQ